jgi:hypothetical protein
MSVLNLPKVPLESPSRRLARVTIACARAGLLKWVPVDSAGLTLREAHEWLLGAVTDRTDHVRSIVNAPLLSRIAPHFEPALPSV